MTKWFPLVMVLALAAIGTPLEAGIFDHLVNDTAQESVPLSSGGGEIVHGSPEIHAPAPTMDHGYADHGYTDYGSAPTGYGYPFKTDCCESKNVHAGGLWRGYCSLSHGASERMHSWLANCAHRHAQKGGCATGDCGMGHGGKGGCATGACGRGGKGGCATGTCGRGGKGGCATGTCGRGGKGFSKGFGHVQHGHIQRSHVQRGHILRGHVQHGKGISGCNTCGQSPCGCGAKGHHQKGFSLGFHGKSHGRIGFGHGQAFGGHNCKTPACGKGPKHHCPFGLFGRSHHCDTCGKSAGFGFGKGGCDCGSSETVKGWSQKGGVIWDDSHSFDAPQHGQPTRAYDPPVELEIPEPVDSLPVPSTPTGHSARIRRLPATGGYHY